jgi:hypothetical protein
MIFIFDNGEVYSNHALYFVDAPEDFGAWFNDVYLPWIDGAEYRPLMIVATAPAVERRERVPYNPRPSTSSICPSRTIPCKSSRRCRSSISWPRSSCRSGTASPVRATGLRSRP